MIVIGYLTYNELQRDSNDNNYYPTFSSTELNSGIITARSLPVPDELTFAGESVPLYQSDVKERLDRELHINTYWHNNTIFLIKRANRWFPVIEEILREKGIPEDFKYLAAIESNLLNDVSPKNAVGFWQIRRSTGRELGLEITREVDERYNPVESTKAACKYLKKAYDKFGSWTMVAGSYNRGISGIQRAINNQKVYSYYDLMLNNETSRYVFRILAIKEIIENRADYYFDIKEEHLYEPYEIKQIEITQTIPDLVEFSKTQGINYKLLKQYNPWLRQDKLTVRSGKKYSIAVPVH